MQPKPIFVSAKKVRVLVKEMGLQSFCKHCERSASTVYRWMKKGVWLFK